MPLGYYMRTAENLHPVRTDLKAKKTRTGMYKLINILGAFKSLG